MGRKTVAVLGTLLVGAVLGTGGFVWASASPKFSAGTGVQALQPDNRIADFIKVRPDMGPGGTEVRVKGYVASPMCHRVQIFFIDSVGSEFNLGTVGAGSIDSTIHVPLGAATGQGSVRDVPWVLFHYRCGYFRTGPSAPFAVTNGPGIFGFTPRKGPVGTVVTITGIRFTGATKVKFNGTPSVFTVDSDTQITATVPDGATTGPIKIVTPIGKAESGPNFKVT